MSTPEGWGSELNEGYEEDVSIHHTTRLVVRNGLQGARVALATLTPCSRDVSRLSVAVEGQAMHWQRGGQRGASTCPRSHRATEISTWAGGLRVKFQRFSI